MENRKSLKSKKIKFLSLILGIGLFFGLLVLLVQDKYTYNNTPSFPLGWYEVSQKKEYKKNDLILFCPPGTNVFLKANEYKYIKNGSCESGLQPLIKKIVGIPGDKVEINKFVFINDIQQQKSKVFVNDIHGRKLNQIKSLVVKENEFFVMSDYNEKSFDSRYFGTISKTWIKGKVKKINFELF